MIIQALILPILVCFALVNISLVLLGYWVVKHKLVWLSWLMLLVSIALVYLTAIDTHPILKMLVIIATTFTAMKVVAVTESYKTKKLTLQFKPWFVFATGWAGMRAEPFETLGQQPLPNAWQMIRFGISRVIAGGVIIILAHQVVLLPLNNRVMYILVTALLLVGLSLILHFGLLSISAGTWRLKGANTYYLFKQPVKAMSLTEFWGKRWNMAFSEMTSVAIFRPLRTSVGAGGALMIAFIFSGLLHELALSLPVNSGYGLPTLYFIIQGILVLVEKLLISRKGFLKDPVIARLWTLFWVIAPMPLLFHEQFIKQIVWPLVGLRLQ
ncbi:wax synthase family protein [Mucilaginibacter sp. FT3.2]|uniref:wax synthase family protein n=1 Tax=Mucilaginibacter sp. FT3.2 TaxID=2723090 RepID=UPI00161FA6F1|nr:membrane bound O-acyl transferase family-domain-containing protein [Mucilaginibacter sp. FT3.2]MBB6232115.1 alginate O-acetyltransferase complex protein AlgI [Mucilaginibacter sp. FT3.2]